MSMIMRLLFGFALGIAIGNWIMAFSNIGNKEARLIAAGVFMVAAALFAIGSRMKP